MYCLNKTRITPCYFIIKLSQRDAKGILHSTGTCDPPTTCSRVLFCDYFSNMNTDFEKTGAYILSIVPTSNFQMVISTFDTIFDFFRSKGILEKGVAYIFFLNIHRVKRGQTLSMLML